MRSEDSREAPDEKPPVAVPKSEAVTRRLRSTPPPPPDPSLPIAPVTVPTLPPLERLDGPSRATRKLVLAAVLGVGALSLLGVRALVHTQPATAELQGETVVAAPSSSAERAPSVASESPAPPSTPVASTPAPDVASARAPKMHKAPRTKADDLF